VNLPRKELPRGSAERVVARNLHNCGTVTVKVKPLVTEIKKIGRGQSIVFKNYSGLFLAHEPVNPRHYGVSETKVSFLKIPKDL
jgi:hypothetical protein